MPAGQRPGVKFNLYIPKGLFEQVQALAEELEIGMSELLRDGACLVLAEAREARAGQRPLIPALEPLRGTVQEVVVDCRRELDRSGRLPSRPARQREGDQAVAEA